MVDVLWSSASDRLPKKKMRKGINKFISTSTLEVYRALSCFI